MAGGRVVEDRELMQGYAAQEFEARLRNFRYLVESEEAATLIFQGMVR